MSQGALVFFRNGIMKAVFSPHKKNQVRLELAKSDEEASLSINISHISFGPTTNEQPYQLKKDHYLPSDQNISHPLPLVSGENQLCTRKALKPCSSFIKTHGSPIHLNKNLK